MSKSLAPTINYTLIQGSYWGCYCAIVTFSSVYLLAQGFTNAQIGTVIALSSVLSAVLQPVFSGLADRLKKLSLRQFAALLVLVQLAAGALLLVVPGMVPQALLYGTLIVMIQVVLPLCSALGMACINSGNPMNFGVARGAGSISYGVFSSLVGQLVLWFGEVSIPVALTLLNLVLMVAILAFKFKGMEDGPREEVVQEKKAKGGKPFPLKYHGVIPLVLGVVLLLVSHNVLNTFAFQIVTPLGGDSAAMGNMLLIQSLVELPVMFLFSWMIAKASSRFWLCVSGVGFFCHALGAFLAPNMFWMNVIQIFEMPGYAVFALASIYFVNEMVAESERVQGQAWITMAMTLGNVLASFVGGLLLDYTSVFVLLTFATLAGAVGMLIFFLLLRKGSRTLTPVE
ncbi:MAG: MFS transporter [Ruminiclostridium sp.]|nr:MFS transporter [Ruminiclostridium sp.]